MYMNLIEQERGVHTGLRIMCLRIPLLLALGLLCIPFIRLPPECLESVFIKEFFPSKNFAVVAGAP